MSINYAIDLLFAARERIDFYWNFYVVVVIAIVGWIVTRKEPLTRSTRILVAGKTGAELDRQFRENVIVHHEEGLGMIEKYMTRLTRAEVRQMAEKMKADQTREIAELRSELKGT